MTFAKQKTPFRLVWTAPNGMLAGAYFDDWDALEAFSKKCVKAGLCPQVPIDSPTPYDSNDGKHVERATP